MQAALRGPIPITTLKSIADFHLQGGTIQLEELRARLAELRAADKLVPGLGEMIASATFSVALNGEVILSGEAEKRIASGDVVELVPALAGG